MPPLISPSPPIIDLQVTHGMETEPDPFSSFTGCNRIVGKVIGVKGGGKKVVSSVISSNELIIGESLLYDTLNSICRGSPGGLPPESIEIRLNPITKITYTNSNEKTLFINLLIKSKVKISRSESQINSTLFYRKISKTECLSLVKILESNGSYQIEKLRVLPKDNLLDDPKSKLKRYMIQHGIKNIRVLGKEQTTHNFVEKIEESDYKMALLDGTIHLKFLLDSIDEFFQKIIRNRNNSHQIALKMSLEVLERVKTRPSPFIKLDDALIISSAFYKYHMKRFFGINANVSVPYNQEIINSLEFNEFFEIEKELQEVIKNLSCFSKFIKNEKITGRIYLLSPPDGNFIQIRIFPFLESRALRSRLLRRAIKIFDKIYQKKANDIWVI